MAISKLILNGVTQMDVTQDTVAADNLLLGETATKNDGTQVTGTYVPSPAAKHTATITVGCDSQTYVTYNNTVYRSTNSTFEFSAGDTCTVCAYNDMTGGTIYVDDVVVASTTRYSSYSYILPDCDINLELSNGGTAYVKVYTVSGTITVNPLSVTENGTYTAPTGTAYSPVTVNVSDGGSDTYSPKNDGKTHIWVRLLSDDCKTVYIRFSSSGGTVDWGDDSTSTIAAGNMSHTYSDLGLYDISFNSSISALNNIDYKYRGFIEAIEMANTNNGSSMFDYCGALKWIYYHDNTMTGSATGYYINYHNYNLSLQYCRLDSKLKFISDSMFYQCQSLQSIEIPDDVTSIGTNAFSYCRALESVIIPENVTSIGNSAFRYSLKLVEYHLKPQTPPTLGTNALQTSTGCVIYVPYSADHSVLNAYQTETNWSAYASYMQEEPA